MMRNPIAKLSVILIGAWITFSAALAEIPPVSRTELLTATIEESRNVKKVLSHRIEMAPQIAGQKHLHPMPVVGYVVSGEIAFQIEGKELQILKSGDAFFEPANAVVVRWENVGTTQAVFIANYISALEDDELLIRLE